MSTAEIIALVMKIGAAVAQAIANGEDVGEKRVKDLIPGDTQLHLARAQAEEKARAKFGPEAFDAAKESG